ncbi:hypothetical protein E1265_20745 [Streptomyces sp. 8K308]|uniref:hypothetical protein n=1 Tax=Streptomyces sp. 8K308 TaxID=2530388 RepID=UPI0010462224|nr:hypothetical protein [Streptomyces sp. 8K308]TDC20714.1 hypothetical protein E1265_20745 [Streptomyces sp. 8K308]
MTISFAMDTSGATGWGFDSRGLGYGSALDGADERALLAVALGEGERTATGRRARIMTAVCTGMEGT